jgi:hypothetical protein
MLGLGREHFTHGRLHVLAAREPNLREQLSGRDGGERFPGIERCRHGRRRKLDRAPGHGLGEIEPKEAPIDGSEVIMSARVTRSPRYRELELALCLLESPELEEHRPAGDPKAILLRCQPQSAFQGGGGLRETARSRLKLREVGQLGRARPQSGPTLQKFHSIRGFPAFGQKSSALERVFLNSQKRDGDKNRERHVLLRHAISRFKSNRLNLGSEISDSKTPLKSF